MILPLFTTKDFATKLFSLAVYILALITTRSAFLFVQPKVVINKTNII